MRWFAYWSFCLLSLTQCNVTDVLSPVPRVHCSDIDPDAQVKQAMSSIQTAERRLVAAEAEAAAAKIRLVKAAEAEGESTRIQAAARAEGNYLA
jgi:regulator of protease activity HflC (stomatin/prohibitin superfamily)